MASGEWQPARPPAKLTRRRAGSRAWAAWLMGQGYAEAERKALAPLLVAHIDDRLDAARPYLLEVNPLLKELDGEEPPIRFASNRIGRRLTALEIERLREAEVDLSVLPRGDLTVDERQAAATGAAVQFLCENPPAMLEALERGPVPTLSPAAFGARLGGSTEDADGGWQAREDVVTGQTWWVRAVPGAQAGEFVIAAAIYRLLGLDAPEARLATVAGKRVVAMARPTAWLPFNAERDAAEVNAAAAADRYLGFDPKPNRLRSRRWRLDDPAVLRLDLFGVMRWASVAKRKDFGAADRWVGQLRTVDRPMQDRIAAITDAQLRQAVSFGALEPEDTGEVLGALIGRREALRARLDAAP